MPLSKRRTCCRLCESANLELALPLTPTPVADHFIPSEQLSRRQELFPLDLHLCMDCGHMQLLEVVDPRHLFENYIYFTSVSPGLVEHFRRYAESVSDRFQFPAGSLVVDIGSNTGTLLQFFKERGFRVLGVDPAKQIAQMASAGGTPTIGDFFTPALSDGILAEYGSAQIVTANNVFAHADDLAEMAEGIRRLLAPDGVFIFEVNHLVDIYQNMLFDTVYHEHLCYHSVRPLLRFLKRFDMEVFDVLHSSSKGGSIRVFAQKIGGPHQILSSSGDSLKREEAMKIHELITWERYTASVQRARSNILQKVIELRKSGARIVGFGASPTVTTLLYHFDLAEHLDYLVDDNKNRHGLFSPGHHLAVHPPQRMRDDGVEYALIMAWRYAEPIRKNHVGYVRSGGQFIVPLPELRILSE
jgi:SAM-dependent methyltransferase